DSSPSPVAETTGDFLLDFHHVQITFGQIVVKRHFRMMQKSQYRVTVVAQSDQQVSDEMLRDTLFRVVGRGWMGKASNPSARSASKRFSSALSVVVDSCGD